MVERAAHWTTIALVAVLLASCGGGADASSEPRAEKPATTTTTVAPTTTTTIPPPYSFDGSVPPPPLLNTGTDYAAIYESLVTYSSWLKAHDPKPDLLGEIMVVGSDVHTGVAGNLQILLERNLRLVETRPAVREIEVVTTLDTAVSLRVVEHITSERLVLPSGETVDELAYPEPPHWTALLQADATGRWRIASIEPTEPGNDVDLSP